MHAILGNTYPMWGEGTWQYPPLFFTILAGLSGLLRDEILALKVSAVFVFSLRPLTTYVLARELFRDRFAAVAAAWLAGLSPIFVEMFGWGGYPNLLAVSLLPLAFYGIVKYARSPSLKSLAILSIFSAVIPISHHLTFIVFIGAVALWTTLSLMFDRGSIRAQVSALAVSALVFVLYRLAAGPSQFLLFNEAALYGLRFELGLVLWMFKDTALFALLYFASVSSAFLLLFEGRYRTAGLLLASWGLVPIFVTQGYLLGLTLDYQRIFFFMVQPFLLLAAAPFVFRSEAVQFIRSNGLRNVWTEVIGFFTISGERLHLNPMKHLLAFAVLILALASVLLTPFVGAIALRNADSWYNFKDPFGDGDKLSALEFIASNTSKDAVFVADDTAARWIEGYAQRRVVMLHPPMYLFMDGELERERAARAMLFSYFGLRNDVVWVLDQAPYGEFSPIISLFLRGDYRNMVFVAENSTYVVWTKGLVTEKESLANASRKQAEWIDRGSREPSLRVSYFFGDVQVVREVSVKAGKPLALLRFYGIPVTEDAKISQLAVDLVQWGERTFFERCLVPNGSELGLLEVVTDVGRFYVGSTSKVAFPFVFTAKNENGSIAGEMSVGLSDTQIAVGEVESYGWGEIASIFGVDYVVIPRKFEASVEGPLKLERQSIEYYDHLLRDPNLSVVYENKRVLILQVP